jgi:hypothetical protein
MPQIIVAADRGAAFGEGAVTFRERVNVTDFESEHFAAQLVERLGWAVEDADVVERRQPESSAPGTAAELREETADEDADEGDEDGDEGELVGQDQPGGIPLSESAAVHAPA